MSLETIGNNALDVLYSIGDEVRPEVLREVTQAFIILDKLRTVATNAALVGGALRSWVLEGRVAADLDFYVAVPPQEQVLGSQAGARMARAGYVQAVLDTLESQSPTQVLGSEAYAGSNILEVVEVSLPEHPPIQIIFYCGEYGLTELVKDFPDTLSTQVLVRSEFGHSILSLRSSAMWRAYHGNRPAYLSYVADSFRAPEQQSARFIRLTELWAGVICPRLTELGIPVYRGVTLAASPEVVLAPIKIIDELTEEDTECKVPMF